MDLNRVEWSLAQDLLLKLVQILSPLAERETPVSLFLNQRFFIPPAMGKDAPLIRSVRLLTTLHSVQKQVEEMIGAELPASPQKEVEVLPKAVPSRPEKQKKEAAPQKKPPEQILSRQAQKLIDQVQDAIGKLCHSANIKDPKEEPLRAALKQLKPNLDRIIEGVAHEEIHSEGAGLPPFRFALTRSPREELIKRLLPFPQTEIAAKKVARPAEADPISKKMILPNPELSIEENTSSLKQEVHMGDVKPLERNALPATPFVPLSRQLTPARKKKKRKGFWFRDEEEDGTARD